MRSIPPLSPFTRYTQSARSPAPGAWEHALGRGNALKTCHSSGARQSDAQLGHGLVQGLHHHIDLRLSGDQRGDETQDVAGSAVDEDLLLKGLLVIYKKNK